MKTLPLREVAHTRAGEKGDDVMLSVIAYRENDYHLLQQQVTREAIESLYSPLLDSHVDRYDLPQIAALNFVLHGALSGGRSRTIVFEESGKALASLALMLPIDVPSDFVPRVSDPASV